jgi:hypothetical protein
LPVSQKEGLRKEKKCCASGLQTPNAAAPQKLGDGSNEEHHRLAAWLLALRLCFHAFGSVTCERASTAPLAATLAVDGHVRWLLTDSFGDHSSALIPFDISKTLEEIRKGKSRIGCIWSILEAC